MYTSNLTKLGPSDCKLKHMGSLNKPILMKLKFQKSKWLRQRMFPVSKETKFNAE